MKHDNFNKFPKDYKTFPELADYARKRAVHSAARNGHQEFAYWHRIAKWAEDNGSVSPHKQLEYYRLGTEEAANEGNFSLAAQHYAYAVHCRQMIVNSGGFPARLSLAWLRKASETLIVQR